MPFTSHEPFPHLEICDDPEHSPPGHIVLPEGIHTYECPTCGAQQQVIVQKPKLGDQIETVRVSHPIWRDSHQRRLGGSRD